MEAARSVIQLVRRDAATQWRGASGASGTALVTATPLGFAGAAEADRRRWLNGFRRLLDALDSPLQVVVSARPGPDEETGDECRMPADFSDMRGADLAFVERVANADSSHVFTTSFATTPRQAERIATALREVGIACSIAPAPAQEVYGRDLANVFQHVEGWSRSWYVERFPGTELEPGWLHRLIPPGLAVNLAWHATPLPLAWVVGYLQRQLINMRATRMVEREAGSSDPALAGALPNTEDLQRRLAASQDKAFHVSLYVTLTATSRDALELGALKIEAAAKSMLCDLQPCTFRMVDGHLATLSGGPDRLQRQRVLDTTALITFFPWHETALRQEGGFVVGRHRVTGAPVMVDPFDQRRYANANVGVFGHSGAGKTYLLSALAMGALGTGAQIYIIDPEHEYGGLARELGGVEVRLALGSGHALNVLDLRPADRRDESWIGPAVADAVDLCACVCGGLDESERAVVESAVRQAYADLAEPLLCDVADKLPRKSRIAVILRRWASGSLGQMFSAPTNVDLEAPIVAFGMRELRDEMIAPVHFLLAEALWARIKRRDRRRILIVDELGLLFEDATIRRFVVSLARRIRKYNGSLVFATQNPGDLLATEQGAVVATNPALLFLGAQRPGEAAKLEKAFDLSAPQRSFLEAGHRGDFLLVAGSDRLPVHVQAPPWQEEAMRLARAPSETPAPARPPPRPVG